MRKPLLLASFVSLLSGVLSPAQTKKILVMGLNPAEIQELQSAAPEVTIEPATREQLPSRIADADAIVGTIRPEWIRAATKLRWVQVFSAGVESVLSPELRDSQITLTNCKIIQGPNIADHAIALLLSLTRGLYRAIPARAREEWARGRHQPIELQGKTAVILGLGGIGMQIAQRAHAFGMRIIGVDPKDIPLTSFVSRVVPPDRLDSVLPEADVVFVAVPLTEQTERMIGARQFELMKPNSYFIAVSRGKTYDTGALVRALDSKHLAGAGLDVTDPEPLPKGHPLWKFENVVITPHIAGSSDRVHQRRIELFKENVRRFARGEPLLNVVDKRKGY